MADRITDCVSKTLNQAESIQKGCEKYYRECVFPYVNCNSDQYTPEMFNNPRVLKSTLASIIINFDKIISSQGGVIDQLRKPFSTLVEENKEQQMRVFSSPH